MEFMIGREAIFEDFSQHQFFEPRRFLLLLSQSSCLRKTANFEIGQVHVKQIVKHGLRAAGIHLFRDRTEVVTIPSLRVADVENEESTFFSVSRNNPMAVGSKQQMRVVSPRLHRTPLALERQFILGHQALQRSFVVLIACKECLVAKQYHNGL